jgi:hypothetical protein
MFFVTFTPLRSVSSGLILPSFSSRKTRPLHSTRLPKRAADHMKALKKSLSGTKNRLCLRMLSPSRRTPTIQAIQSLKAIIDAKTNSPNLEKPEKAK